MSILSLNGYLDKLKQLVEETNAHTAGTIHGWDIPRQSIQQRQERKKSRSGPILTVGSKTHVLNTVDITTEVLCEQPSAHNAAARPQNYSAFWFSGGIGREINPNMAVVLRVLKQAFDAIRDFDYERGYEESAYLLHVGDYDRSTVMTKPTLNNYSYMGSQMTIISPSGRNYSFTMDRTSRAGEQRYPWLALTIPKSHRLAKVMRDDMDTRVIAADGYIDTEIGRIAFFKTSGEQLDTTWVRPFEYATLHQEVAGGDNPLYENTEETNEVVAK